ncbi:accessory protein [denestis virus]|uniref:Accessory protein n=1 Tax=denestis virus TaxID=2940992 RepID=A0AAE9HRF2_9MONO|nr:accessory protein [denestis virus]
MPSKLWRSLKKLRVPRLKSHSSNDSQSSPLEEKLQSDNPEVKVRVGVRKNPDLVGVEKQCRVKKQDLAAAILSQLRDLEKEYPAQVPRVLTNLEYSTLQFVKTILMRVMEGAPVNSVWMRQVEEYICTTPQEKENLNEAMNWVKMMMEDQDRTLT